MKIVDFNLLSNHDCHNVMTLKAAQNSKYPDHDVYGTAAANDNNNSNIVIPII